VDICRFGIDQGTSVDIYLPAIKEKVKKMAEQEFSPIRKTGTVLLIEDEDIVMNVNSALLRKLGLTVLTAKNARDAIEIAGTYNGDIDCAILDIMLPDMEGKDIYPLLMEKRPSLKVIVCSGYSIDGPAQQLIDKGANGFLPKPFTLANLSQKLNEILIE
jgi:CheY-like chemotaxis protein